MFVFDFPGSLLLGEGVGANAVLALVGAEPRRYADQFIHQQVADFIASVARQYRTFGLTLHVLQLGDHGLIILDAVFRENAPVIRDDHHIRSVVSRYFFGRRTNQAVHLFQQLAQRVCLRGQRALRESNQNAPGQ